MGAPSKIDRLIELGLNRYGAGDLDGALLLWEEALAIDPENPRATSYIDYVRLHYAMLTGSTPEIASGDEAPMGIEENPEYQIEISPGDLPVRESQPSLADDAADGNWFDDEATRDVSALVDDEEPLELELEADLPPPPEVNFEDATREYYGTPTNPKPPTVPPPIAAPPPPPPHNEFENEAGTGGDFAEVGTTEFQHEYTGGFQPEGTPVGFGHQETEIKKRDLGFVQPTASAPAPANAPVPVSDNPSSPLTIGSAPTIDTLQLGELTQERLARLDGTSPGEKTTERASSFSLPDETPDERDLLEGLPVPNRPQPNQAEIETQDIPVLSTKVITKEMPEGRRPPSSKAVTKELPDQRRPPARRDSADLSQAEVVLNAAATRDFTPKIDIGAPTRELGIRPPSKRPGTLPNPVDEDAPTKQSDVRAIRETAREQHGRAQPRPLGEVTNNDIRLPFDPVEQKSGQILDEIDAEAPPDEAGPEQTRRRINLLLERAVQWNQGGDPEKAVLAVDLALDEDPNSAVAQKLITRHKDAIMAVMQSYLGDLDRQPQLAKSLQDLQSAPINPRAAFLLSRIDGTLTIDELLDVSGMPRLEAYRHLCQLYLRGILR